jgi:hypothetical protein
LRVNRYVRPDANVTPASWGATPTSAETAATLTFQRLDAGGILDDVGAAVFRLGPCRNEAMYHLVDDVWRRCADGQLRGATTSINWWPNPAVAVL